MLNPMVSSFIAQRKEKDVIPAKSLRHSAAIFKPQGITALPPVGHLVKENIIQSTGSSFKMYYDCAKDFYNAVNGRGNDYSVGKINDLAGLLGGLGISSVLLTGAKSPLAKGMKFVGFGCWFAAMTIWPKVFIGAPIKALTGVDVNQEYVNIKGHRKKFFGDYQYIPWDLMSDKKINKIGDKLGIPQDIKDRREAIQNKMKQIAIQANTLWMMTAGFATPIMATLMADQLQKPFNQLLEKIRTEKAAKQIEKVIENPNFDFSLNSEVKGILESTIDDSKVNKLREILDNKYGASDITSALKKDFEDIYSHINIQKVYDIPVIDEKLFNGLSQITGLEKDIIKSTLTQNINETAFSSSIMERRKAYSLIRDLLKTKVVETAENAESLNAAFNSIGEKLALKPVEKKVVDSVAKDKIKSLFEIAEEYLQRKKIYTKLLDATIADKEGSQSAHQWSVLPQKIIKILGIEGDLEKEIAGGVDVSEKLDAHFRKFVQKEGSVEQAVEKIVKLLGPFIKQEEEANARLLAYADKMSETLVAKTARDKLDFKNLNDAFGRLCNNGKGVLPTRLYDKLRNTHSSFLNIIKVLDAYQGNDEIAKEVWLRKISVDFFHNKFEEYGVTKPSRYYDLVERIFKPFSQNITEKLGDLQEIARNTYEKLKDELTFTKNPIKPDLLRGKELPSRPIVNFDSLTQRKGASFDDFVVSAAKKAVTYKKFFKIALGSFGALTLITWGIMSQFGKKNKFNQDIYIKKEIA